MWYKIRLEIWEKVSFSYRVWVRMQDDSYSNTTTVLVDAIYQTITE